MVSRKVWKKERVVKGIMGQYYYKGYTIKRWVGEKREMASHPSIFLPFPQTVKQEHRTSASKQDQRKIRVWCEVLAHTDISERALREKRV